MFSRLNSSTDSFTKKEVGVKQMRMSNYMQGTKSSATKMNQAQQP